MLLTSARLKPCNDFACASSPSRVTTILPSATFRLVRLGNSQSSLPFGPSTKTFCPFTSTFTLGGMAIGCFPIRDINLPDVAEQFSAEIFFACLIVGHHAFRRGDDRDAEAAAHARNFRRADIFAQTGFAHALQAFDDTFLALILELNFQLLDCLAVNRYVGDVTLLLQNLRDIFFDAR